MLVSTECVCARASMCLCVFASVHVRANLGLIIKALLLADAQTGWQTNRQANAEHSTACFLFFFLIFFLLWPNILSSSSCQLILIHSLLAPPILLFKTCSSWDRHVRHVTGVPKQLQVLMSLWSDVADLETPSVFVVDVNWLLISLIVVFYVRARMVQFAGE